jgi:hypothetical protein
MLGLPYMTPDIILSSLLISSIALLWKLLRSEKVIADRVDRLKPVFRRQMVCSPCLMFWLSLFFSILFNPLRSWTPRLQVETLWGEAFLIPFVFQTLILSVLASAWFHLVIILIETSHSLTEKAANKS